jgi:diguanylate cyclase (GGDEF)-like protein
VHRDELPTRFETSLVCLEGAAFGQRFALDTGRAVIGRDPDCDFPLDDLESSWHHARIEPRDDGLLLVDLGSRNGTFVNGTPIDGPAPLKDGDLIAIGAHVFKFLRRNTVELAYHERMSRLSSVDELTGAMNRRAIHESLSRDVTGAQREGYNVALIMFDIDHFKRINDTWGHAAGDVALIEVVRRIQLSIRSSDRLGRVGGEEFLVVLPDTNLLTAAVIAERLRSVANATPVTAEGAEFAVSISLGVTDLEEWAYVGGGVVDVAKSIEGMLGLADAKLYEAKNLGRNRVAH